ncbi:hypothetical protein, partial [Plasticicumulans sp.]|uniref:hypothetical protein n=1 Tax=Plasticicumulans sp. TaxID=2307179 RepID=UPI00321FA4BF
ARLDAAADDAERARLQGRLDLLHRTRGATTLPLLGPGDASLVLARVTLTLTTLSAPQPAAADVAVDNLIREFAAS